MTVDIHKYFAILGKNLLGSVAGKTVKIRRGPAAVTGDKSRSLPLFAFKWEGAGNLVNPEARISDSDPIS